MKASRALPLQHRDEIDCPSAKNVIFCTKFHVKMGRSGAKLAVKMSHGEKSIKRQGWRMAETPKRYVTNVIYYSGQKGRLGTKP
nr:MAG TPA: hypothetical protein [Caudoviricetes sp.]